jgi:hypothetical protein
LQQDQSFRDTARVLKMTRFMVGWEATHANILADVHNFNYWMRYTEGGIYLHAAPIFHIADFPSMFAAPAFGASP